MEDVGAVLAQHQADAEHHQRPDVAEEGHTGSGEGQAEERPCESDRGASGQDQGAASSPVAGLDRLGGGGAGRPGGVGGQQPGAEGPVEDPGVHEEADERAA